MSARHSKDRLSQLGHEESNSNLSRLVDAFVDRVDCGRLQVFDLRKLADLPSVGTFAFGCNLARSIDCMEYSESAIC